MNMRVVPAIGVLVATVFVGACSPAAPAVTSHEPSVASIATEIYVYKSPTCSCCHEWEAYLIANGYTVHSIPTTDMTKIKEQMGVPEAAWSCHTAVIDGYVVEGHVPIEAIRDLLSSGRNLDGIALPGMPSGSPGMPGVKAGPLEVLAIDGGETSAFAAY